MTQNINIIPEQAQLQDLLNYYKKLIKLEINCHHIATITEFNPTTQTAQATINYTKTFLRVDEVGDTSITPSNYAQLIDCPVICLGGGSGALTFPIQAGDECLVLFNDRDFDNWFNGASNAAPQTPRSHAFADAVILVGIRSLTNVVTTYDDDATTVRLGNNKIRIYEDKVMISLGLAEIVTFTLYSNGKLEITNATGEFVSVLSQLFTDIQTATTNTILGPQPLIMPTFVANKLIFDSFKV